MKTFEIHPYAAKVRVYRKGEEDVFEKRSGASCEASVGMVMQETSLSYIMYVGAPDDGVLVHELFHLVLMVLNTAGVQVYDSWGEPGAYLIEDLFNRIREYVKS